MPPDRPAGYGELVRTNLTLDDIGGLLDEPLVAVLATLRSGRFGPALAGLARVA